MIPILFVDSAEALGGAERSLLLLMEHLDGERFLPILACNEGPLAEEARTARLEVHSVPMPRLRDLASAPASLVKGTRALTGLIRERRVALVHSNVMRASFYAAAAARWARRPFVWHARDIYTQDWYVRLMCAFADRVLATSEAVAAPIRCRGELTVVYNGLALDRFAPALHRSGIRTELGLPRDVPVVGTLGRVQPWKRHDLFLRMAARVHRFRPDVRYAVVGDTIFPTHRDHLGELRALSAELGLAGLVVFPGFRTDVAEVLASLDVVVHTAQAEPFGRVLIEAMAMGRPVVAFAGGGVQEIVVDGETGRILEPGDVEGMADAVLGLLDDAEMRRRMGAAGRRRVESRFDACQTARRVEAVYDALLSRGESI